MVYDAEMGEVLDKHVRGETAPFRALDDRPRRVVYPEEQ